MIELTVDNFAGGGGASFGIEAALGRPIDFAINHDPEAVAMHAANHPQTKHFCEDVWQVDPMEVTQGKPVGLAWFSPDCFPAGTLVLTRDGYQPIEQITTGDEVLTHKLRWRKVIETSNAVRPLMVIRGHGHPGLAVSPEHPFLARQRATKWNNTVRAYCHWLEPQDWVPASALNKGWYWATPRAFPSAEVPAVGGRGMIPNVDLMWLAGRYLGDGWTRLTHTRAELVITCGKHETDRLRELLSKWPRENDRSVCNELAWSERATTTAYQFTANHRGLVEWLREHFGHRAEAKGVPAWALGIDEPLRAALLDGYLSADGWRHEEFFEAHTVSKSLAFGIKALANSMGRTVAIYLQANSTTIQGREVNALSLYKMRWRHQVAADHEQTEVCDGLEWCPIRESSEPGELATVFNIGVEEDESYIAEGIVVHNCKHFSRAKGGKPVSKRVRGLAWIVIRWAKAVKPRVIMLENVSEFATWGPLLEDGSPCPVRKGFTFRRWHKMLENLGYRIDMREMSGCDYGAPTIRRRLFIIARRDGLPIVWPQETHGRGLLPYRTAAECIDWSIPCPSIFERPRPLADATLRRIARGITRYVVNNPKPFIVQMRGTEDSQIDCSARPLDGPLGTVSAGGIHHALVTPLIASLAHGDSGGKREYRIEDPLGTVSAGGIQHALVSPVIMPITHSGERRVHSPAEPLPTVTCARRGEFALVSPTLIQTGYGERDGQDPRSLDLHKPLGTAVAGGVKHGLVAAFLARHYGGHENDGAPITGPMHTVTAKDHHALVHAFLLKYYGTDQNPRIDLPLGTVTTKDRFGLVTVMGDRYYIADIGMRMLAPRELFNAQGFPRTYKIDPDVNGKPLTKTAQVRCAGNSVCPDVAEALVRANLIDVAIAPAEVA